MNEIASQSIVVGVDVKLIGGDYKIFLIMEKSFMIKNFTAFKFNSIFCRRNNIKFYFRYKNGFDIDLYKQVENEFDIPIIASGGASSFESFIELFDKQNYLQQQLKYI